MERGQVAPGWALERALGLVVLQAPRALLVEREARVRRAAQQLVARLRRELGLVRPDLRAPAQAVLAPEPQAQE